MRKMKGELLVVVVLCISNVLLLIILYIILMFIPLTYSNHGFTSTILLCWNDTEYHLKY